MKRILAVIIFISALFITAQETNAQTNNSPNNYTLYNSWNIPVGNDTSTGVAYYNGRVDTLPNYKATNAFIRVGGAHLVSLTCEVNDTCHFTFVVKQRVRGAAASTYTTILDDSLANWSGTISTNKRVEWSLRDSDSDLFDAVDSEIIIIVTHSSFGNDTQGTARRKFRLNWK